MKGEAWPAAWTTSLADTALVAASSAAVFARGQAYARSGAVSVDEEDPMPEPALRARVTGTADYRVEVWIEADALAGECDCPHAADGWFCKHQVAVALVWRRLGGEPAATAAATATPMAATATATPSAPSPTGKVGRAPRTALDRREALRTFLHAQDAASLADKLLNLAGRHRDIDRELQQWRKLNAVNGDWRAVRRVVTDMLSAGRGFISWGEGGDYVARASAVLPVLRQARARDPNAAVALTLHALRTVWAVMEEADDSDGMIGEFCATIGDEFITALQAAPDQPSSFADVYLALRIDEPFAAFNARSAEAALGAAALAHYRQTLRSQWRAGLEARLAARAGADQAARTMGTGQRPAEYPSVGDGAADRQDRVHATVERLHLEQLLQAGDIEEALAVLRADLSTPWAHRRLIGCLEQHGRWREAFAAAEAASRRFPGDRLLEDDLLRCYERDGWTDEAFALRQKRFEREPSVTNYEAVVTASAAAGRPAEETCAALFQVLQDAELRVAQEETVRVGRLQSRGLRAPAASGSSRSVTSVAPNVSLRASILCSESRWLDAWAVVQPPHRCADAVLQTIARNLPLSHQQAAVAVLTQVFERAMSGSSSPYREALALVADIASRLPVAERTNWYKRCEPDSGPSAISSAVCRRVDRLAAVRPCLVHQRFTGAVAKLSNARL